MKKNHILLIIRHPVGGIRTYIKYIYGHAVFKKYNFTVLIADKEQSSFFIKSTGFADANFVVCKRHNHSMLARIFRILLSNQIDLIHSHGYTSAACAALPAKILKTKHVMTVHDVLLPSQFSGFLGRFKKYILSLLYNQTDIIYSVSTDAENNIKEFLPHINNNKLLTIEHGIDINQFTTATTRNLKVELNLSTDIILFGFFGRFMSQKGFKFIIDAIEILDKQYAALNIKIISFGADGFIKEDSQLISKKNLDQYFVFLPPKDNISPSLNGVDAVLMPSLWEACGLVAMEALVAGKPLIASNCIGLREVIKNTPTYIIEPGNARELAGAIDKFRKNPDQSRFSMYRENAALRFDSNNTAQKLYQLYDTLIKT